MPTTLTGRWMWNPRKSTAAHLIVDGTEHYENALNLHRAQTACGRWMRDSVHDHHRENTMTNTDPVEHFLNWLIAMDEPANTAGMEARRTVTLTEIIRRARLAQSWREVTQEPTPSPRSGVSVTQTLGDVAAGTTIVGYTAR